MSKKATEPKPAKPSASRLSPELDEFLHVMSALENHLAPPVSPAAIAG